MVPLLRFYFHEEVRQAAVQSLPELLRSANLAAENGLHGATKANVKQMLDFFWPQLLDAMAKVPPSHTLCCHQTTWYLCSRGLPAPNGWCTATSSGWIRL